ncbi:MAG TPA: MarR family transcriptional regulator [Chloroflexota bacterium]|nr:MarR family transcriptional regulator [Chloroflexota bacterium]
MTSALVGAFKVMHAVSAAQLAPFGLHPGQDRLLAELWVQDGISQTELARRLGVEQPTVTKTLQRLERAGLVRRQRDPEDNRQVIVSLTVAGRAAHDPIQRLRDATERQMAEGFSAAERRQFSELLDRVRRNLQQMR